MLNSSIVSYRSGFHCCFLVLYFSGLLLESSGLRCFCWQLPVPAMG